LATQRGVAWCGVAGVANVQTGEPVRPEMLFGIGSITKVFVAVVILQLIEARKVSLDDTAAAVLGSAMQGIPNADEATIAQLLNHTAGVPSWEDDTAWIRDGRGVSLDVRRIWGKTEALDYIRGHAPVAPPGEKYSYSNTNYTLLGLIIEAVTGSDAANEIRRRILDPLSLTDVYLEGFEPVPSERLPHRYHSATAAFRARAGVHASFPEVRPGLIDVSEANLSVEWTAGGMVAAARDLAAFGAGLHGGKLLSPQSMVFMTQWLAVSDDVQVGHNLQRRIYPGGLAIVGHNGDVLGFRGSLYWIEGTDSVVAMLCNLGAMHAGDVPVLAARKREFIETALRLNAGSP
jgi:D-alanyl-D-alanine carboxypeptidase